MFAHIFSAHPGEGRDPGQVTQLLAASIRHGAAAGHFGTIGSDLSWIPAFAGMSGGGVALLQSTQV